MKNNQKFQISVTSKVATMIFKAQLGNQGIDPIEFFLNFMGENNETMLEEVFARLDPDFHVTDLKEGDLVVYGYHDSVGRIDSISLINYKNPVVIDDKKYRLADIKLLTIVNLPAWVKPGKEVRVKEAVEIIKSIDLTEELQIELESGVRVSITEIKKN